MATRGILLCADDYGIAPGVGRAIRDLVELGRLSAVSCMTAWPDFPAEGRLLEPLADRVDLGLHLGLTAERSLARVTVEAYLGRLDPTAVATALQAQLAAFAAIFGRPPDFIDGHQHVHLLPGVREQVAEAASRLGAYLRLTDEPLAAIARTRVAPAKAVFLSLMGRPLARQARRRAIRCNRGFRGARSFAEPGPFRELFRRMIAGAAPGTLVMCHPGLVDAALDSRDSLTRAREEEYRYFAGSEFPADLAAAQLRLVRFRDFARADSLGTA
ncbi:MAG: ChbG/HpnK family deacetylase [Myxococcota bacterium]